MTRNTQDNQEYYREEDFQDERKKERPARSKAAVMLIVIMAVAVLVLLVFLVFHVRKIEVTGNQYVSEDEVVQWVQQDTMATNSLYILFQQKFNRQKELPLVEETVVSLKNPWTIHVEVYEKSIIGYLENNGQRVYFDEDGGVILISEESMEGVSRIDGLTVDLTKVKEHETMSISNPEALTLVTEAVSALKRSELSPDSIHISGSDVSMLFGVVTVNLGSKDLETRIAQLPPVLSALNERYPGVSGIVHLENYNTSVKRIGFIPTPAEEPAPVEEEGTGEQTGDGTDAATGTWTDPAAEVWVDPAAETWTDPSTDPTAETWVDPAAETWVDQGDTGY